jgi:hypothetical protein
VRGAWKPIGRMLNPFYPVAAKVRACAYSEALDPRIWYAGGDIGQARYMSRFLVLQIKVDIEGVPFQPYTKTLGEEEEREVVKSGRATY